ncbi:MAG: carboxypeptidase regulatory-like domain-containing protein [Acidimicrobiales bacterium]
MERDEAFGSRQDGFVVHRWDQRSGARGRSWALLVGAALVASLVVGVASPALAANGTVSGTVRSSVGARPLPGATVEAYGGAYGALYGSATSAADGTFSLSLPAGSFRIRYVDPTGAHTTVYWGGSNAFASAATVAVPSAGTVTADWTMNAAAQLGGTVSSAVGGAAVAGATVEVLDAATLAIESTATTDAAGVWQRPVKPGSHKLRITDPSGDHVTGYSGGGMTPASATTVSIAAGAMVTSNVVLHRLPRLQGTVSAAGFGGIAGMSVSVLDATTSTVVATTTTAADGTWSRRVAVGSYKVQFSDPAGGFRTAFNGGATTVGSAAAIGLALDATSVVDAQLSADTMVTGMVTRGGAPVAGITVQALEPFWGGVVTQTTTDGSGRYSLGVAPGSYRIRFHDGTDLYADAYSGASYDWAGSSATTLAAGQVLRLDVALALNPVVRGTITSAPSVPVGGITVEARNIWDAPVRTTTSAADGTYTLAGLAPGTYKLRLFDPSGRYPMTYEGGSLTFDGAPGHLLVPDQQLTVDHRLVGSGGLRGLARVGTFGPTLGGMYVVVVAAGSNALAGLALTQADGTWSIPNLAPGSYKVAYVDPAWLQSDPPPTSAYRPIVVPDRDLVGEGPAAALAAGATFTVTLGATVDTGLQGLAGYHCNRVTHHPGADLSGWQATSPDGQPPFPNLKGCDLRGASLAGASVPNPSGGSFPFIADLSYADLRGADLATDMYWGLVDSYEHIQQHFDANLTGARIAGASFAGAELRPQVLLSADHDWTGTILTGASMGWPDCCYPGYPAGWTPPPTPLFSSDFTGGTLSPAMVAPPLKLDGASFGGARIDGLAGVTIAGLTCVACKFGTYDVNGSQIQPADLTGAHLPHAGFRGSDLHGANLTNVDLSNADLRDVNCAGANFSGANLTGADLTGASCAGATFTGAILTGATITGATLSPATGLTKSQLVTTAPNWAGVDLHNLNLWGMDYSGRNMAGANLSYSYFNSANLTNVDLTGANLKNTTFSYANVTGAKVANTDLKVAYGLTAAQLVTTGPDWSHTNLTGFDLSGRSLVGRNLTGANLTNTNLSGTGLSFAGIDLAGQGYTITGANLSGLNLSGRVCRGSG